MLWECTVCHYVHKGDAPPSICLLCKNDSTYFVKVEEGEVAQPIVSGVNQILSPLDPVDAMTKAVTSLTYGLFIVTSFDMDGDGNRLRDNGQTANTCFQITSEPVQIAVALNKKNLTHDYVQRSGKIGVSVLHQQGHTLAARFGYSSGRDGDKFAGAAVHRGRSGVLLMNEALTTLQADVVQKVDAGTHTLFLAEVTAGEVLFEGEPMTYAFYRATR
ncbi:MAG: flavin reductase [Gracilibacteraceae bacterium]|nr:flavin reductase [Gracilibacteraceae bacterium]